MDQFILSLIFLNRVVSSFQWLKSRIVWARNLVLNIEGFFFVLFCFLYYVLNRESALWEVSL